MAVLVSEHVVIGSAGRHSEARAFVERLRSLSGEDLALLRRNAGKTIEESRGVARLYRLLVEGIGEEDEVHFLLATLFALNRYEFSGSFGRSMASLGARIGRAEVEHRFRTLLDSEFYSSDGVWTTGGGLSQHLRQLVRLADGQHIGIDWAALLIDLQDWADDRRHVQKRWAESFYTPSAANRMVFAVADR